MGTVILKIENLFKTYPDGTRALKNVNITLNEGEFVSVIGLSGAGKSTLLRSINRLVEPTSGKIHFHDKDVTKVRGRKLRLMRRQIGMVFQSHNLIRRSQTVQNVLHGRLGYVSTFRGAFGFFKKADIENALAILDRVGLSEQALKRADELSGGQQQRVGIARAIAQKPSLILADEPIASLDPSSSEKVMNYLWKICKEDGITALVNLHQVEYAKKYADRIIGIQSGEVVFNGSADELTDETVKYIYKQNEGSI